MLSIVRRWARDALAAAFFMVAPLTQAQSFERLSQFETGADPLPHLAFGTDGNYYGTTERGGNSNAGTVFRLTPSGVLTTILSFNEAIGSSPTAGLVSGDDGNFYGATFGSQCVTLCDERDNAGSQISSFFR